MAATLRSARTRRPSSTRRSNPDDRQLLLQIVQEAYQLPTWNGTNLRAAIRRVPAEVAGWLAPGGRRSIADIVVHCAYWKYAIRRQLTGDQRGSFDSQFKGSNWFRTERPLRAETWASYVNLLDQQHAQLCDAIVSSPARLLFTTPTSRAVVRKIFGLAIHDAYHTGQVQLIKKLWKRTRAK